jgi:phosphoenolpyruvate carboxykinase (ATP)
MKDPTIPPIVRLKGASLASVMGATLATKRSTAERLQEGVDPNALVVEPYANPFRTYPLINDYEKFKKLVAEKNVACYIINTGDFMGKKINKEVTLGVIEAVVDGTADFKPWGPFSDIEIFEQEGFVPDLSDHTYVEQLKARMQDRLHYVDSLDAAEGGFNKLPDDAGEAIRKVVDQANSL